jgi:3-hydroxyisobutyrate dehydrogenase-like beta-hydroxyacid dehydrogenase
VLIGFAGLGRMGLPMAHNLAAAGYPVLGHDPATPSAPTGIDLVDDPAALAAADLTISMLPDAATTRALVLDGLAATPPDHLHVVMGTVGPDLIPELAGWPPSLSSTPRSRAARPWPRRRQSPPWSGALPSSSSGSGRCWRR